MRAAAAAALLVLATSPALAQELVWDAKEKKEIEKRQRAVKEVELSGRKWRFVAGESYDVYAEAGPAFTAELSLFMDELRKKLSEVLRGESKVKKRPCVFVYATQADFKKELRSSARGWFKYAYDGQGEFTENALYTYLAGDEKEQLARFYRPILLHEGTHQLLRDRLGAGPRIPKWLDEGLACYFQLWDIRKTSADNAKDRSSKVVNREYCKTAREKHTVPALDKLLATRDESWAPDDFGPITKGQYAAAEALLVSIMRAPGGPQQVARCLEECMKQKDPAAVLDAKERKKLESEMNELLRAFEK